MDNKLFLVSYTDIFSNLFPCLATFLFIYNRRLLIIDIKMERCNYSMKVMIFYEVKVITCLK